MGLSLHELGPVWTRPPLRIHRPEVGVRASAGRKVGNIEMHNVRAPRCHRLQDCPEDTPRVPCLQTGNPAPSVRVCLRLTRANIFTKVVGG